MRRHRPDLRSIQNALKGVDKNNLLDKRRRRLYNRKYRKSLFFISTWIGRLLYFTLFVIVSLTFQIINDTRQEVLNKCEIERYQQRSRRASSYRVTELSFQTQYGSYKAKLTNDEFPKIKNGDTVTITRNYYGRPIYFTQRSWAVMYSLTNNLVFYSLLLFPTIISFFFNDGFERFTNKLLLTILIVDIIAIALYFLTSF